MIKKGYLRVLTLAFAGLLSQTTVLASDLVVAGVASTTDGSAKKAKLIDLWEPGDSGQRMNIRGRVTGPDGEPLAGIEISVSQPDGDGDWIDQYTTTLMTDAQGRYQFGSVVPESNSYCGEPHVRLMIFEDGWDYYDKNLLFAENLDMASHSEVGTPVFLEESTVNGETIMFGRYDIVLSPR
jgi:protocatechuate 3,4-dioxygenase beta subunit